MKRIAALFLGSLILLSLTFAGCDKVTDTTNSPSIAPTKIADDTDNSTTTTEALVDRVINIYSATDEVPRMVMRYKELHPGFKYRINMFTFATADMDFHIALDNALAAGGADIPDIYCVESARVMKYSQGDQADYAMPYRDIGIDVDNLVQEADIAKYVIDIGTNPKGEIVGLGYQGTGGAFIYRRSIAKTVWGTDDPEIISYILGPGWD